VDILNTKKRKQVIDDEEIYNKCESHCTKEVETLNL
jgi:hypothetical protein